jgi:hypothetical protein
MSCHHAFAGAVSIAPSGVRQRPGAPAGLPSATPHDRRRRLRPDAGGAGLVDAGAMGGDAPTMGSAVNFVGISPPR